MPKVSIIIPVYNVERYVSRCVRSLFEQTLDDIEFIFVDDASPDNSIAIIKSILLEYPARQEFVRFIKHETNKGLSAARNSGLKVAMENTSLIVIVMIGWILICIVYFIRRQN